MRITYLGHSGLLVEGGGKRAVIDPFLSGNPMAALTPDQIKADAVILTHGHSDHSADAVAIAQANDCPIIAVFELAGILAKKGVKTISMNTGGKYDFDGIGIKMTLAFHSSSYEEDGVLLYAGQPVGILLTMGGKTLYHAGDTSLFSDMKLIGERHSIDIQALPIGDHYTMGPEDAIQAAEWIGAKRVIPIHYDTFPFIKQDSVAFSEQLLSRCFNGHPLKPGQSVEI